MPRLALQIAVTAAIELRVCEMEYRRDSWLRKGKCLSLPIFQLFLPCPPTLTRKQNPKNNPHWNEKLEKRVKEPKAKIMICHS